ncbi:MAG: glutaredoxin family protein [Candidatus Thorarchaeota archaeon]
MADKDERNGSTEKDDSEKIEVVLFKSDSCAFCPRAEEVVRETIENFGSDVFTLRVINVSENPEAAEEYGIFALPTIMIGGVSVTGIPEPDMLMKMVLGAKVLTKKKEGST